MKKFVKYWIPPLAWVAVFFPVGNVYLSRPWLSRLVHKVLKYFIPDVTIQTSDFVYIVVRKSMHFIEFAVLAFLLYRAIRGLRAQRWNCSWALWAGLTAAGYGLIDEGLQRLVPGRQGSFVDWGIDTLGVTMMLAIIKVRSGRDIQGAQTFWTKIAKANYLKRTFDLSLSGLGLILSSPLWLIFSILIWTGDGGRVFYLQERVGKGGRNFKAFKFRSMIKDAEKGRGAVQAVENDPRVTRIGRILRATAMDELPQLLNIFKGDMSFVGPRALRPAEKEVRGDGRVVRLDEVPGYKERLAVQPGLTGLAQVFLPAEAPRKAKFRYDRLYIRRRSFWLDMKLMMLSFWITFRGKWESREKKV